MTEVFAAIIGGIVGAFCGVLFGVLYEQAEKRKRQALDFYNRFMVDRDFRQISRIVARLRCAWEQGDRQILEGFQGYGVKHSTEAPCENGMTAHQNLSYALHFWAAIQTFRENHLVDDDLLEKLLSHAYSWNAKFYHEIREAYLSISPADRPSPHAAWVTALPKLEELFCRTGVGDTARSPWQEVLD